MYDDVRIPSAKTLVKRLIVRDVSISVDAIKSILENEGVRLSRMAIVGIRREFRDDMEFLAREGALDLSSIPRHETSDTPRGRREPDNSVDWGWSPSRRSKRGLDR